MPTCEDNVGLRLKNHLFQNPNTTVLSYHPPNGKAYETDLIRIPKRGVRETAVRDRYHIDLIFVANDCLVLVELKCHLSESGDDIEKLREIRNTYTLPDLLRIIGARLTTTPVELLHNIRHLVLALGVETIDREIPQDFVVFEAQETKLTLFYGNVIPDNIKTELKATIND